MIHMPNASAVIRGVTGTMMPLFGVGSRCASSLSVVLSPMWQQIGSPISSMSEKRGS